MKKLQLAALLALLLAVVCFGLVAAQDQALSLSLSRDFGYGGFNGDIQGLFTMHVSGPADLAKVDFFIDDTQIGEMNNAPFALQFKTDSYPAGQHRLYAVGTTTGGQTLRSQTVTANFITAAASGQKTIEIVVPILVIVFAAVILSAFVPALAGRNRKKPAPGEERSYPFGGGICKNCSRPVPFPMLGMHLLNAKLVRCPNCGKWELLTRVSMDQLRAAEQAELEGLKSQVPEQSAEDKARKDLDDSKYQGL